MFKKLIEFGLISWIFVVETLRLSKKKKVDAFQVNVVNFYDFFFFYGYRLRRRRIDVGEKNFSGKS